MNNLQHALEYVKAGWSIIPIKIGEKKPAIKSWEKYKTVLPTIAEVTDWWTKNPEYNIAVVCGKVSGIIVVDIDNKPYTDTSKLQLSPTRSARSGGGGTHLFYKWRPGLVGAKVSIAPGVDIRSDFSYIILPPSLHASGSRYEWINEDEELIDAPSWLQETENSKVDWNKFTALGLKDGQRNISATQLSGKLVHHLPKELWESIGWSYLKWFNQQYGHPPLAENELRESWESIKRTHLRSATEETIAYEFLLSQKKEPVLNTENICRVIRLHPTYAGNFRFDEFSQRWERRVKNKWIGLATSDAIAIQTEISKEFPYFARVGKEMVYDAMLHVANEQRFDSAKDYLTTLKWDKTPRLDKWLVEVYGTPDDPYHHTVGSNWIKGLVKRIIEPGCKFDFVLVLEGEQGWKKSTSLYVLGGEWHVETTMTPDNKDFFMQMQGKAIIEFSEGETLSRTEVKRMKAVITTQFDKFRPPYERISQEFPRRCVFAMTTNQAEYLKDETGNRRYLPVTLRKIANIDWLKENRDQLFAEAYHRLFTLHETVYEFPESDMLVAQEERRIKDPNEDTIADWYFSKLTENERKNGVTIIQGWRAIVGDFGNKMISRTEEMSIATIFKKHLNLIKKRMMVNGARFTFWFSKEDSERVLEDMPRATLISQNNEF